MKVGNSKKPGDQPSKFFLFKRPAALVPNASHPLRPEIEEPTDVCLRGIWHPAKRMVGKIRSVAKLIEVLTES